MHNLPKTLDQICDFFAHVPGVEVLGSSLEEDRALIELLVTGESTILALQHMTMGANVALQPWLRHADIGSLGSQAIKQTFSARTSRRDHFKFGELQMLGVWLVWYLHKVRVLTADAANVQLHFWQGARVDG